MTPRAIGVILVLASAVPFALAGIFTRLITVDLWSLLAWRGLIGGAVILVYAMRREGLHRLGTRGWLIACVSGGASVAFLGAFRQTHVANVALIYTLAPFVAGALDWLIRREPVRRWVMTAAGVSLFGVAIVVTGGAGAGRLAGDALALVMTVLMALTMVLIRSSGNTPVLAAMAAAAMPLTLCGLALGQPFAVAGADLWLIPVFGLTWATATVLLTEGARRIPSAEVALLGGADVPLAVIFAMLILGEVPPLASWIGGAIVLAAVFGSAVLGVRAGRAKP